MYIKRFGDYNPSIPYYALDYFYNYPSFAYVYYKLLDRINPISQNVSSFILYSITDNIGTFIYDRIHWLPVVSSIVPVNSKIEYRTLYPILEYVKVCTQESPQQNEQQTWPPFIFPYNFALCLMVNLYNFYTCVVYNQNCICGATRTKFDLEVDLDPCNNNLRLEITKNTIFEYKYRIFLICNNNLIYSYTINYTDNDIIHDINISSLSSYFNCNVKLKIFTYYLDTLTNEDILVDAIERELDYLHTVDITVTTRQNTNINIIKNPNFIASSYSIVIKDSSNNVLYSLINTGDLPNQINIQPIYVNPLLIELSYNYSGKVYNCNKVVENVLNFSCKFYFEQRKIYDNITSSCNDDGCDYFIIAPNSVILPVLVDNTLSYSYNINISPSSHCIDNDCNTNHSDEFYLGDLCRTIVLDDNILYDISSTVNITDVSYSQTCNVNFKKPRINLRYYSYLDPNKINMNYIRLNVLDLNFSPITYVINYSINGVQNSLNPMTIPYTYAIGMGNNMNFDLQIYSAPLSNLLNYDFDNRHYYYYREEWGFSTNDMDFEISLLDCFSGIKVKFNNIDFNTHKVIVSVLNNDIVIASESSDNVTTLPEIPVPIISFENYETLFIQFTVLKVVSSNEFIDCEQTHYNKVSHILDVPKFDIIKCTTNGNETLIEIDYNGSFLKLVNEEIDVIIKDLSNNIIFQQNGYPLGNISITPPIFDSNIIVEISKALTYLGNINCVFTIENSIEDVEFEITQTYRMCDDLVKIQANLISGSYITYICDIELLDINDNLITSTSITSTTGSFNYDLIFTGLGINQNEFYKSKVTIKNIYNYTITTNTYIFYYFTTSIYYDASNNSITIVGGGTLTQTDIQILDTISNNLVYTATDINGIYSVSYIVTNSSIYDVYVLSEVTGYPSLVHQCIKSITVIL